MILNCTEAALHLGYRSRTTLQRLLRDGHLSEYRLSGGGRQVLLETDPPGMPCLRSAVQALTQIRYSSPLWRSDEPEASPWDGVAERLNSYLGDSWPTVPWSGDQVATLALLLSMAKES
ncbi:MAG: hypothetical protein EBU75_10270 [Betaproteobacteria bacterium]|nr:hypothetical protein [Betaproteobacteria bacterium]